MATTTTLAAALADTTKLHKFDRRTVAKTTIKITKAGDGLSKALGIEPQEFDLGDTVYVVLKCTVGRLSFEEIKDSTELVRVHTLAADGATIVDGSVVKEALDEQAERIRRAEDAAHGREPLNFDGDDEFFDIEAGEDASE